MSGNEQEPSRVSTDVLVFLDRQHHFGQSGGCRQLSATARLTSETRTRSLRASRPAPRPLSPRIRAFPRGENRRTAIDALAASKELRRGRARSPIPRRVPASRGLEKCCRILRRAGLVAEGAGGWLGGGPAPPQAWLLLAFAQLALPQSVEEHEYAGRVCDLGRHVPP